MRLLAVTAVVAMSALTAVAGGVACSRSTHKVLSNPFAPDSPWRQEISPTAVTDPNSAAMIGYIESTRGMAASLVEFGIPIFLAGPQTPAQYVTCTEKNWGICPFASWPVPSPVEAEPNSGSDGAMVIVDEERSTTFEFWRASKADGRWSSQWGAVNSLRGSGWGGAATGSGASRLAGVIRVTEIEAGAIPHALALQSNNACKTFRPPALKSDGTSTRADCIPEGARLQLDPSLNLSKLNLTEGELAVATAMQRYGGYIMDVSGAPLSVTFELDTSEPHSLGKAYREAGFRWDYDSMEHVPWEKLRVLS